MATMDIFAQDAFSMTELTRALEDIKYKPGLLSGMGLFDEKPVRVNTVMVESRGDSLALIPFSERGAAPTLAEAQIAREVRAFVTQHFAKQDTIYASEIQGIRAFGSESELQQVQTEVARRLAKLRRDAEVTFEYHYLNAIDGVVKDPGTGATIVDYYSSFGISRPASVDLDLDNASPAKGALRKKLQELHDTMESDLEALAVDGAEIMVLCGQAFFRDLTNHPEVREAYLNTARAAELLGRQTDEFTMESFRFRKYRGGAGVSIATDEARAFFTGIDGLFELALSPADTFDYANTPGQLLYARTIPDRDRNAWAKIEIESNPLPLCTRPKALRRLTRT